MNSQEQATIGRLSEDEVRVLEMRWYEGRMLPLAERLVDFVRHNREAILAGDENGRTPAELVAATKRYITQRGSMHMQSELTDQIREIQNELWYCGERGDFDSNRIKREWADKHAPAWRRWRINEYLFIADKCVEEIVQALA